MSRNLLKDTTIINDELIMAELKKESVKLNKPVYSGASVLDISKYIMYDFFYNKLMSIYGRENITMLYTDTDSFILEIKTDDLYDDILKNKDLYDLSEMTHSYFIDGNNKQIYNENKKVFGKFKDETKGIIINKFIALKSKMYCYTTEHKTELRAKGIKKLYAKENLNFNEYYKILFGDSYRKDTLKSIRSFEHEIHTIQQSKISLSTFDDKRYYLDAVNSLPYGHYSIKY